MTSEPRGFERATVGALGPDVQEGSAGIGLFLTHLHAMTGDDAFRRTAVGAFRARFDCSRKSSRSADA